MRKFIIVLLGIIFLITPFCYAAWKFNPHTNKMDFYEDVETTSGWSKSGTSIYPTTITDNVGIGNTAPWQELTVSGDVTISDDTPNLTFRDSDDNTAWQWHADTAAGAAPWQGYALWRGTDSGSGFSVNPSTPLMYFESGGNSIFATGNVGIGVSNPARKLDIIGTIRTTDTAPMSMLLINLDTGTYPEFPLSIVDTVYVDKVEARTTSGSISFELRLVDSTGTTPLTTLTSGTMTTSLLTLTPAKTVPSGNLVVLDIHTTAPKGRLTIFKRQY